MVVYQNINFDLKKGTAAIGEKGHGLFGRENVRFSRGTTASKQGTGGHGRRGRREIWGLKIIIFIYNE